MKRDVTNEDILRRVALFRELDDAALRELSQKLVELSVPKDEYLFVEDDPADAFYVVCSGAVILVRDAVGRPLQLIGRLGAGDCCGVTGLFDTVKRSTSAKAVEPCRILKVEKTDFLEFIERHPALALELQMKAAERHRIYAAAALDLGRRSEVRIRIDRPTRIVVAGNPIDADPVETRVDNISNGGLCLASVPEGWTMNEEVDLRLEVAGAAPIEVRGRVAWIREGRLGIAFIGGSVDPKLQVQRLLQELLIFK